MSSLSGLSRYLFELAEIESDWTELERDVHPVSWMSIQNRIDEIRHELDINAFRTIGRSGV